ncbi:hypothetical protein [Streptomyces sp. NPDC054834]
MEVIHEVGGSVGVAVLSTVAVSGIEHGAVGGFRDAFAFSAIVAAVGAVACLVLVPHLKPQTTDMPHAH